MPYSAILRAYLVARRARDNPRVAIRRRIKPIAASAVANSAREAGSGVAVGGVWKLQPGVVDVQEISPSPGPVPYWKSTLVIWEREKVEAAASVISIVIEFSM